MRLMEADPSLTIRMAAKKAGVSESTLTRARRDAGLTGGDAEQLAERYAALRNDPGFTNYLVSSESLSMRYDVSRRKVVALRAEAGVPATRAAKLTAIAEKLVAAGLGTYSDDAVAAEVGVSANTVGNYRRRMRVPGRQDYLKVTEEQLITANYAEMTITTLADALGVKAHHVAYALRKYGLRTKGSHGKRQGDTQKG